MRRYVHLTYYDTYISVACFELVILGITYRFYMISSLLNVSINIKQQTLRQQNQKDV